MAAKNYLPREINMTQVATGTSNGNQDLPAVPASRRWAWDTIEVRFSARDSGNKITLRQKQSGGAYENIAPQEADFKRLKWDLRHLYPMGLQVESADILNILFERGATSVTIDCDVWVQERDE